MKLPNLSLGDQPLNRHQLAKQHREADHIGSASSLRKFGIRPSGECGCEHHCLGSCIMGSCIGTCSPI